MLKAAVEYVVRYTVAENRSKKNQETCRVNDGWKNTKRRRE